MTAGESSFMSSGRKAPQNRGGGIVASDSELLESETPVANKGEASTHTELSAQWARFSARLQNAVGEVNYRAWMRHMSLGGVDGDEVTVHLPTAFMRDWVRDHYGATLRAAWQAENPAIRHVDIRVGHSADAAEQSFAGTPEQHGPSPELRHEERAEPRPDALGALDTRYTFASFVVGKPNEFAYACARRVAEQPACQGFNPLFLYGGVGLGKTHLMLAIAWELNCRNGGAPPVSVAYMSAERFMYRFIAALRSQSTMDFKDELRRVDVLMVDDLQFLTGKESTQEEFFHTFNALVEAGKQIVVSADKSPSDLSGLEDRLRTRLGCGMVADLHATTFELRMSILGAKAADARVDVPDRVMEFLAHKITGNVRELEGALNRLIGHAELFGQPITLESTQDVLRDLLKAHDRRVTIDEIQRRVCEHYKIRATDMASPRRARNIARPRQVAMYLAKVLTSRSLPEIGRKFGNRDHTTVMHAVARIGELMERDPVFAEEVDLLRQMLEA
jgi:chromosomal replication initiator protein